MTVKFTREQLLHGLNRLLELCENNDLSVRIQVVGGCAVVLQYNQSRQPTVDVDCVVLGESSHRDRFIDLVRTVADDFDWPDDWLNQKVGIFWPETNEDKGWVTILEGGNSRVEVAGPRMLLAMKLRAGRPFRDISDIEVLLGIVGVGTIRAAEEVFDEYFPYDVIPNRTMTWLREKLVP